jgi:hypothetical protein
MCIIWAIFEFSYYCLFKNFEYEFNFSNSSNFEKFLKKVTKIMKNCLFFISILFRITCFESTRNTFQIDHFKFSRRWPHICYMFFDKSYAIFLWFLVETIWKYFGNFPHFLFKHYQTYFLESPAENIENGTFIFFKYVLVLFLRYC